MKAESLPAPPLSRELIGFLQGLDVEAVPAAVKDVAKWCLLDGLGCVLFGSTQEWSRIMREEMAAEGARGSSTVVGHAQPFAAPAAALCNGTAAHGFELDDLLDEPIVHPGAIIIPAALATAESINASGARLLLGIIAGYESMNRIGLAMGLEPAHRGFHKTALVGPVGAAIAASVVMNLSAERLLAAAGLACSTASGVKSFAAGTGGGMMKRMHAGRAAESGVRMAQLAARDFTAPPSAIDGRFGLLECFGGKDIEPTALTAGLGKSWATDNVYVKVYPCCSWIQAAVQQLVALRGDKTLAPNDVAKIRIGVSSYAAKNNGAVAPPDIMGAQYSFPYCAALALTADPTDPAMYTEKAINDTARRELAMRVELYVDAEMEAAYPKHYGSRIEVQLANGKSLQSFVMDPHGMPADPVTETERLAKFSRLAAAVLPEKTSKEIIRMVRAVETLKSARELSALLRGS
ncbi:MAG: MmgE/PrpD family protein [Burkholderiales bacterium]